MKFIISFVEKFLNTAREKSVTCGKCRNVSLNDKRVVDVYTEVHCLKEEEYLYCDKQGRYVRFSDEACGEYTKK